MEKYLSELNKDQRKAVEYNSGPSIIIAGPGSGKTKVLTNKLAYLIKSGVNPFNILALTFTNKSAKEMKNRVKLILDSSSSYNTWMGTFHSVFYKILRIECDKINYEKNFTIYDSSDSKNLIKKIIKDLALNKDLYKPNFISYKISSLKNNLITWQNYSANIELKLEDESAGRHNFIEIYKRYQKKCFQNQAMDFDDLLLNTYLLLKKFPDILFKYQNKFKYILVDEYQDTNYAQYKIINKLAEINENICVVGDDSQSIYAFRGANIKNILNFKNDYPDHKMFKLEQNYRSTKKILDTANTLIKNNQNRIEKKIWTNNQEGNEIIINQSNSDFEEGDFVTKKLIELNDNFNNSAILYRMHHQSRSIEESLRRKNIPYQIYGGISFYERKEIKDVLAYFKLTINNCDEESLFRIINFPSRLIGKNTVQKIALYANQNNITIWEALKMLKKSLNGESTININDKKKKSLIDFYEMMNFFKIQAETKPAIEVANYILEHSNLMFEYKKDITPEGKIILRNIEELINGIKEFSTLSQENFLLSDFISEISLMTNQDKEQDYEKEKVTLMTIHASKGLEFKNVFIVGLEEGLLPADKSQNNTDIEEERRLFYVAITRAINNLILSYARFRNKWGERINSEPSRFIFEINKDNNSKNIIDEKYKKLKKLSAIKVINDQKNRISRYKSTIDVINNYKNGDLVTHKKFGIGKIIQNNNEKCIVDFKKSGKKTLLLRFAKLKLLK